MIFKKYPKGATPLTGSEQADLIPHHITTQEALNRWEKANISQAEEWASVPLDILTIGFVRELHYHMFDVTWKWAGTFRSVDLNLGVSWHLINEEVKKLCDNTSYQIEQTTFLLDEIALRFHHKLVCIHPFVNGNDRHARLIADLLIKQLGNSPFHWGTYQDLIQQTSTRKQYIDALQAADHGDYKSLITFARIEPTL